MTTKTIITGITIKEFYEEAKKRGIENRHFVIYHRYIDHDGFPTTEKEEIIFFAQGVIYIPYYDVTIETNQTETTKKEEPQKTIITDMTIKEFYEEAKKRNIENTEFINYHYGYHTKEEQKIVFFEKGVIYLVDENVTINIE